MSLGTVLEDKVSVYGLEFLFLKHVSIDINLNISEHETAITVHIINEILSVYPFSLNAHTVKSKGTVYGSNSCDNALKHGIIHI